MGTLVEHPTTSWEAMQDGAVFYSKHQVYSMQWNIRDLSDFIIAGARFGGPLALMRDNSKFVAMGRTTFTRPQIQVYSSAGALLMTLNWELGKIVRFGWTIDEELVVLNEEGVYRIHNLQSDYRQFSLGSEAAETGILDARIWENGLVALTGALTLSEVKGWQGGKPLALATAHLTQPPFSWAVIPPELTTSRHVEVLLSVESTILNVDNLECVDQQLERGPFSHIVPSPNGKSLALMTAAGVLWVVSSDFQKKVAEYDTSKAGATGQPKDVGWCGNDAIIVNWDALVLVVGPYGETLKHYYISPTYLVPEIDGIRVFSAETCDFLYRVPGSSEKVFRPGSTSPAAILYDAADQFDRRSPKADESIRSIKPDLASAVDVCVEAAGQEWEATWQRKLLNAAKFGRAFLDLFNPTEFVTIGKTLRVLNAVHHYEVGIPITLTQYNFISPGQLLARLTSRSLHLLALRVAGHLSIKPDAILKHWACAKIARAKPSAGITGSEDGDDEVCKLIVEKFEAMGGGGSGVSYAEIAKRAWEIGRTGLATKLLDHETRAAEQVPLLLGMKEDRRALEKAVDSGDTDLVYHVLLHLHKRLPLGDFFRLIEEGGPKLGPASRLLQVYAREQNREMLRDFYYSEDRRVESGLLLLEEASIMTDLTARTSSVKAAQKFFSEDTQRGFEARMIDDSARLLAFQQMLEKDTDGKVKFVGASINETIIKCITTGIPKRADKARADWKVPDKRFWYLKLRALTEAKDWEGLDAFAKSKKSPIGYEPFVRHLAEKGFGAQGTQFVPRCDAAKRAELYALCGDWRQAGKEAKERGDKNMLAQLRKTCPDALIARELDQLLNAT